MNCATSQGDQAREPITIAVRVPRMDADFQDLILENLNSESKSVSIRGCIIPSLIALRRLFEI